ncbi:MAG: PhoH family protein, partial [Clostridia bacterium]
MGKINKSKDKKSNKKDKREDVQNKEFKDNLLKLNKPSSKCLNEKQSKLKNIIKDKDIIISTGPAGTGKTYVALQTSFNILLDTKSDIDKIVLCKSVTTIPKEETGFLPGSMKEKMEPFMISFTSNIDKIFKGKVSESLLASGKVEIQPLAFIRG